MRRKLARKGHFPHQSHPSGFGDCASGATAFSIAPGLSKPDATAYLCELLATLTPLTALHAEDTTNPTAYAIARLTEQAHALAVALSHSGPRDSSVRRTARDGAARTRRESKH